MSNIKLKFRIEAYFDDIELGHDYKEIITEQIFNSDVSFRDALKVIYQKYSLDENKDNYLEKDILHIYNRTHNLFDLEYDFKDLIIEEDKVCYGDVELKKLENQFSISKHVIDLMLDPGIGGSVGEYRGIHFYFHTDEKDIHHKPHIHCKCSGEEMRIDLINLSIIDRPFKNNKRNKIALDCIKENQQELIKYWNRNVINGESVKLRMYIPKI